MSLFHENDIVRVRYPDGSRQIGRVVKVAVRTVGIVEYVLMDTLDGQVMANAHDIGLVRQAEINREYLTSGLTRR